MRQEGARTTSQRQLRVGEELRHALAWILERGEVRDPALTGLSVTVTEVRVTPDLRHATAFVVPLGGGGEETVVGALTRARGFLRQRMADTVRLKHVPDLAFRADASFDQASRIETLLRTPRVARDLSRSEPDQDREETGE